MKDAFCADLHRGPKGHPANDETPGFDAEMHRRRAAGQRVWCAGDMNELLQFCEAEIPEPAHTDVEGNHDMGRARHELIIEGKRGRTLLTHGADGDPWWAKVFGPPGALVARVLECFDEDADLKLIDWTRRHVGLGRYGRFQSYAPRLARRAAELGCYQVVFGHLHQVAQGDFIVKHCGRLHRIHVVCCGCCCNGRLDFVEVDE